MIRKDLMFGISVLCLAGALFAVMPTSALHPYNPWWDLNDDGKIDIQDFARVSGAFGTHGQPLTKAAIQYDSGWLNITDKCGQNIIITHGLNSTDPIVDIQGRRTANGGSHQILLGGAEMTYEQGLTYGGTNDDYVNALVQTADSGYAFAGYTFSFGAGASDFWLVKTDASGIMQWNKTYGGASSDAAFDLVQTGDGGYALAGFTCSSGVVAMIFGL